MSFLHYLGLLFLSFSWLWMVYIYRPPQSPWIGFVVAGILLLGLRRPGGGTGETKEAGGRRLPYLASALLIPLVFAAIVFPRPFGLGPALLAAAVAFGVIIGDRGTPWLRPVRGCLIGGAVLTLQAILLPLLAVFSAHFHEVPLFGYLLYPFMHLVDPTSAPSGGNIFLFSAEEIFGLSVSWEKLALIPGALFFSAICVARLFQGRPRHSLIRIALVVAGYAALRYMFVVFVVVLSNRDYVFWELESTLLSFIPVALVLAWLAPEPDSPIGPGDSAREPGVRRGAIITDSALIALAAFLVAGSVLFHDPGTPKKGRVLFDEKYSNWEWSTQAYDRDWYGQRSGYNYYNLAEYLKCFYDLERGMKPFTLEYLSQYDVVIIKTPTQEFTPQEIDALVAYVRGGGGLFLIGDHTNVFGTSTYLNPIAERFGLRFNYDSTYQLASMALSYYVPPARVAHPVVSNVHDILFATSCTIDAPLFGENVIIGYGMRGIMLDYSQRSFFPTKDEREYQFGFLMQMAGVRVGRGRVLGFTDSTVFSNFFMFMPGKAELFLGSVNWLNRLNRFGWLSLLFFVCGIAAAVPAGLSLRRAERLRAASVVCFGALLGIALSLLVFAALTRGAYPLPSPRTAMKRIAFDIDPSKNEMPVRHLVLSERESLQTFYVWTQRIGMVPSLHRTMRESLAAAPVAVVVNPSRPLEVAEIDAVVDFCRKGGNFLLIADPENARSSADDFLGAFRMSMDTVVIDSTSIMNGKGERICKALHAGAVRGGTPILTLPGGGAVLSYEKLGGGRFFAFSDYLVFSGQVMGSTSEEPTREQREIYELEFQMLEVLSGEREPSAITPFKGTVKPTGRLAPR